MFRIFNLILMESDFLMAKNINTNRGALFRYLEHSNDLSFPYQTERIV